MNYTDKKGDKIVQGLYKDGDTSVFVEFINKDWTIEYSNGHKFFLTEDRSKKLYSIIPEEYIRYLENEKKDYEKRKLSLDKVIVHVEQNIDFVKNKLKLSDINIK